VKQDTKTAAAKFRALCTRVRCHARTESKEPQHFCIAETVQTLCECKRAVQITTAESVTNIKITCRAFLRKAGFVL